MFGAADLTLPRQKCQHRAGFRAQGTEHCIGHLILNPRATTATEVVRRHRMRASLALYDRAIVQQSSHPGAIERGGHDENTQIVAQPLLAIARQGQPQIGVKRPLMEFVEQDSSDILKRRIIKDHAREHALGDHFDAGARADLGAKTGAQPHRAAGLLPQCVRHPVSCAPGRNAAWLQHQDFLAAEPGCIEQSQRQTRGLPGPRRRDQHGRGARSQGRRHFRQDRINRQRRRKIHVLCLCRFARPG